MGAVREFEREGWQAAAACYEGFAGATRLFVPALLQAVAATSGTTLLDIACGTGLATAAAAAAGARVTGLDFSPAMLLAARRLHPSLPFANGDAEQLPFADASYDAVISNFGIHHVERPDRAVAEARRVLRDGGTFAFTFWTEAQDNTPWRMIYEAIDACGSRAVAMPAGTDVRATPDNFAALVAAAGFAAPTMRCERITRDWLLPHDADLVSIFETGTVRMRTLLRGQGAALAEIRRHIALRLRRDRDGTAVLPTRAYLMVATA
ncbi:MAG: class I SAM-dependent methyltransferase [Alphaproteobacteria bacterium]|nr:class I SAM-dependent methyltransferase [Alphaproteobacteria bacterium]